MGFAKKLLIVSCLLWLAAFLLGDVDPPMRLLGVQKAEFRDKVVLVTGASSGIGAQLARDLAPLGAKLVLTARREDRLAAVREDCLKAGALYDPLVVPMDITNTAHHAGLLAQTKEKWGGAPDFLVLNAGRSQRALAVETDIEVTRDILDLNLMSVISLTKEALPDMIKRGSGSLTVVSSLSGKLGTPMGSSYSASKFALHGYFDALRAELAVHNIHVNMICPGPVKSEISVHAAAGAKGKTIGGDNAEAEDAKMDTKRCTELMLVAMSNHVNEIWISDQPFLGMTYLAHYFQPIWRPLIGFVAQGRANAIKSGTSAFDIKTILSQAFAANAANKQAAAASKNEL